MLSGARRDDAVDEERVRYVRDEAHVSDHLPCVRTAPRPRVGFSCPLPPPSPNAPCSHRFTVAAPITAVTAIAATPVAAVAPGRRRPEGGRWECVAWVASARREHARFTVTLRYIDDDGRLRQLAAGGGRRARGGGRLHRRRRAAAGSTCCGGGRVSRVTQVLQRLKGWPQSSPLPGRPRLVERVAHRTSPSQDATYVTPRLLHARPATERRAFTGRSLAMPRMLRARPATESRALRYRPLAGDATHVTRTTGD